jgi:hypothetical protein
MRTLQEVLRDADPVRREARSSDDRRIIRQVILDSPRVVDELRRQFVAMVAVAALALVVVAAGARYWPGAYVVAAVRVEIHLAEETSSPGLTELIIGSTGRKIYIHQEAVVTNSDIARAQVIPGNSATTFGVSIDFNADGKAKMLRATGGHIGKPLAILVSGEVVAAPTIRAAIGTSAVIDANVTRTEAERIASGVLGR